MSTFSLSKYGVIKDRSTQSYEVNLRLGEVSINNVHSYRLEGAESLAEKEKVNFHKVKERLECVGLQRPCKKLTQKDLLGWSMSLNTGNLLGGYEVRYQDELSGYLFFERVPLTRTVYNLTFVAVKELPDQARKVVMTLLQSSFFECIKDHTNASEVRMVLAPKNETFASVLERSGFKKFGWAPGVHLYRRKLVRSRSRIIGHFGCCTRTGRSVGHLKARRR